MTKKPVLDPKAIHRYGLIGYPLGHSFSASYFNEKFYREDIPHHIYELFPLENISEWKALLQQHPDIKGINVTVPYKEQIMPFLDEIEEEAAKVGAVNTIRFENGRCIGYNTDVYGFEQSLKKLLNKDHQQALILGTGGASKAVSYVLDKLGIAWKKVSRSPQEGQISYAEVEATVLNSHPLIINTTPLGMAPNELGFPDIPYEASTSNHLYYDLIYNPEKTIFMIKGKLNGGTAKNGLEMLILQAEKAWEIWTM